jgi:DNA-binding winged helix-turn-helix (wHTH) protein
MSEPCFRFGPFEVDPVTGDLRKHGVRLKLQKQPFQILTSLVARPNEVVTREELRDRLWSDHTFVDFDHGLNTAVNKLRQALADSPERPRFIETVPSRGYRFIAALEITKNASACCPRPVPEAQTKSDHWRWDLLGAAFIAGLICGLLFQL